MAAALEAHDELQSVAVLLDWGDACQPRSNDPCRRGILWLKRDGLVQPGDFEIMCSMQHIVTEFTQSIASEQLEAARALYAMIQGMSPNSTNDATAEAPAEST